MPDRINTPAWIPVEHKEVAGLKDLKLPDHSEARARKKAEAAARRKAIREATQGGKRPAWVRFLQMTAREQQKEAERAAKRRAKREKRLRNTMPRAKRPKKNY